MAAVGVPETEPSVVLSVRPAGSGGLTAKANGDVPPALVTGVKAAAALLRVRPLVATATAEVS